MVPSQPSLLLLPSFEQISRYRNKLIHRSLSYCKGFCCCTSKSLDCICQNAIFICPLRFLCYLLFVHPIYIFFTKKTVQTGVALGQELEDKMPVNEYYEYFGPDYTLHVAPSNMENKNTRHQLDDIRSKLLDNLSKLRHAPSVQFQERLPDTELPGVRN